VNPERTIALMSHLVGEPPPLTPSLWRTVREGAGIETDDEFLVFAGRRVTPIDLAKVEARLAIANDVLECVDELASHGIEIVSEFGDAYANAWLERIPKSSPPLIYVAGEHAILNAESVGVVGSRDVGDDGAEFAARVSEKVAELGLVVVSGGARGVDQISMRAATSAGGRALGILADSLAKACSAAESTGAFEDGRLCLCSPFIPRAPFSVGNAMARNKLIYAHSKATVVVSAAEGSGGTWSGAVESIKHGWCPVLVWDHPDLDGNQKLIRTGGTRIGRPEDLAGLLSSALTSQGSLF
jgi:predicted Rossmann fold nucleotide-binding protein DprA/Smf involved in DNA uptake